jgi:hypothetical protein
MTGVDRGGRGSLGGDRAGRGVHRAGRGDGVA